MVRSFLCPYIWVQDLVVRGRFWGQEILHFRTREGVKIYKKVLKPYCLSTFRTFITVALQAQYIVICC